MKNPNFSSFSQALTVFEKELNPEQREAVYHSGGPALVIAGAGSGKTRVVTYRVAYLVKKGIPPSRIFLATFTNRAAKEMVRRASHLSGVELSSLWAGTFHHLANMALRKTAPLIGYSKDYTILDREDALELLRSVRKEFLEKKEKKKFPKENVLQDIYSLAVNTGTSVENVILEKYPDLFKYLEDIEKIKVEYEKKKKALNVMDFDDLLYYFSKILEIDKVREKYAEFFLHILVDEYQDTNPLQARIVEYLRNIHRNIMVVGDEHQSIYSFRGARFKNILDFLEKFPDAKIYTIETNYRSTPEILKVATSIISSSIFSFKKSLKPVRKNGEKPKLVVASDVYRQAVFVADKILEYYEEGVPLSQIAVLYRNHFHSMELQMELTRRGIPFVVRSGLRFFEQAHIKDVLAFLKILQNPKDELAWRRVLKLFPGIGDKTASAIFNKLGERGNYWEVFLEYKPRNETIKESLQLLYQIFQRLETNKENVSASIECVLDMFYAEYLEENYPNWKSRVEDVLQLAKYAEGFPSLEAFLSELSLLGGMRAEDIFVREGEECVVLSTVHQAKGLEWKIVFIIWLAENHFPYYKSFEEEEIEEERRLFYVAVTRARDMLYLVYPLSVGNDPWDFRILRPSPFLEDLDSSCYEEWRIE